MTVGDLFLTVNIIIFIVISLIIRFKKIDLKYPNGITDVLGIIFFIISIATILFQGIFYLIQYWNYTVGF